MCPHPESFDVMSGAASEVGLVRERNEDSMTISPTIFAVADGMGGHAAGDVASQLAVLTIGSLPPGSVPDDVIDAISRANAEILASARAHRERNGMGTTITGLGIVQVDGAPQWMVFNVGDSRVYRFADDELVQLTVDHSEIGELLAAGQITPEQAQFHPRRNIVTRSLGTDPAPVADFWVFTPVPGERFLICSDGLTLEVDEAAITDVLRVQPDAQRAADELVQSAVAAGGRDNVTAIVVDLAGPGT